MEYHSEHRLPLSTVKYFYICHLDRLTGITPSAPRPELNTLIPAMINIPCFTMTYDDSTLQADLCEACLPGFCSHPRLYSRHLPPDSHAHSAASLPSWTMNCPAPVVTCLPTQSRSEYHRGGVVEQPTYKLPLAAAWHTFDYLMMERRD